MEVLGARIDITVTRFLRAAIAQALSYSKYNHTHQRISMT